MKFLNYQQWTNVLESSFAAFAEKTLGFIPNIVGALLIFILGWLIAKVVSSGFRHLFKMIGIDQLSQKIQLRDFLDKAHIKSTVSEMLATIVYWVLFLIFVMSALETLQLKVVSDSIYQLIEYIPNIFAAILIIVFGTLVAKTVADFISAAARSADITYGSILSRIAYFFVLTFMLIIALSQVGIDTSVFTANLTVIIGGAVAISVLAVGLGGRSVASNLIAKSYVHDLIQKGDKLEINGVEGTVEKLTSAAVVLKTSNGKAIIPNAQFLESLSQTR